jgi:hypothetical protein
VPDMLHPPIAFATIACRDDAEPCGFPLPAEAPAEAEALPKKKKAKAAVRLCCCLLFGVQGLHSTLSRLCVGRLSSWQ